MIQLVRYKEVYKTTAVWSDSREPESWLLWDGDTAIPSSTKGGSTRVRVSGVS